MTHRSRIVRRKRRTMRGGIGVIFTREGGKRRRTMRGGQTIMALQKGKRRRTMRGGWYVHSTD